MKTITLNTIPQKALSIFIALMLWCNMHAMAQEVVMAKLTQYELKPESQQQFQKVMSKYVQQALLDVDNIMAEAYYEQENPKVLWLIERWSGKGAPAKLDEALTSLSKSALINPAKVYHVKDLEPLTKQQWRKAAKKEDKPLTIMLFVDAKKGTQQNFKTIYHKAMPEFRGEPGVVTYQLSEVEGDGTQFVTYEKFRSNEAFQYHLKFPPIQPVIDYLNTSIKKQPFQQGLHNLIEFAPLTREQ